MRQQHRHTPHNILLLTTKRNFISLTTTTPCQCRLGCYESGKKEYETIWITRFRYAKLLPIFKSYEIEAISHSPCKSHPLYIHHCYYTLYKYTEQKNNRKEYLKYMWLWYMECREIENGSGKSMRASQWGRHINEKENVLLHSHFCYPHESGKLSLSCLPVSQ